MKLVRTDSGNYECVIEEGNLVCTIQVEQANTHDERGWQCEANVTFSESSSVNRTGPEKLLTGTALEAVSVLRDRLVLAIKILEQELKAPIEFVRLEMAEVPDLPRQFVPKKKVLEEEPKEGGGNQHKVSKVTIEQVKEMFLLIGCEFYHEEQKVWRTVAGLNIPAECPIRYWDDIGAVNVCAMEMCSEIRPPESSKEVDTTGEKRGDE